MRPQRQAGAAGAGRAWLLASGLAGAAAGAGMGLLAGAMGRWWAATALLLVLPAAAGAAVLRVTAQERRRLASISRDNARLVDRLRASLERLRESNRLKDDFVAAVSHELRSPLTSIQGSIATLLRDDVELDAALARSLLEAADRQSRRLHGEHRAARAAALQHHLGADAGGQAAAQRLPSIQSGGSPRTAPPPIGFCGGIPVWASGRLGGIRGRSRLATAGPRAAWGTGQPLNPPRRGAGRAPARAGGGGSARRPRGPRRGWWACRRGGARW